MENIAVINKELINKIGTFCINRLAELVGILVILVSIFILIQSKNRKRQISIIKISSFINVIYILKSVFFSDSKHKIKKKAEQMACRKAIGEINK